MMQGNMQGGQAPPMEKRSPRDTRRIIRRLASYVFKWKRVCALLIITILLTIVCKLTVPILVQRAINCLLYRDGDTFLNDLIRILVALVTVFVLNSVIEYIKNLSGMRLSENLSQNMRSELFDRIIHAPLSYLDRNSYGDIMSRLTNDSQRVSTVAQVLEEFISTFVMIIGCGIIMLLESWKLALISIATAAITTIISGIISGRMRSYFMKQTMALGAMNGHIEESMKNFRTMKMAGITDYTSQRMRDKSDEYTDVCIRSSMFSGIINPIMLVLGNLSFLVTVVVGGHFAIDKLITIGVLQAVIMYSKQFMDSVYSLGNVLIQVQSFLASAERVFEVMDIHIEDRGTHSRLVKQGEEHSEDIPDTGVVFRGVSFAYDEDDRVLKDISVEISGGATTALVGATGSGKTTLTSLILKFYDNFSGDIYIDGRNINDYTLDTIRNAVTVVLQDSKLVEGSILDNILYGSQDATEEDARLVLSKMGVDSLIEKMPDGIMTATGDDDETVSEGMRQIIGLARALVRRPRILIMDEALSAVDSQTEQRIRQRIHGITADATILIIAHRLDTIRDADNILVMKDGQVVEQGDYSELMKAEGEYYRLLNSQREGKEI